MAQGFARIVFVFFSLAVVTAQASDILFPNERQDCRFKCHEIPDPSEVVKAFGRPVTAALTRPNVSVLAWNVYKGRKTPFFQDFQTLASNRDIVMLSEATDGPEVKTALDRLPMAWIMGINFFMKDMVGTGLVTGSYAQAQRVGYTRTEDFEPFVKSPKVILLTIYKHAPSKTDLLILNIHGINWVDSVKFERQIRSVEDVIAKHQGPILFAGDFNLKSPERMGVLQKVLEPYGLRRAPWTNARPEKQLDDAFLRGFQVRTARLVYEVRDVSSDHPALDLDLVPVANFRWQR